MKLLIASDIHGDLDSMEKVLCAFEKEGADKLLLLGDLLYHGPRNDLPKTYAPKAVIELLNSNREKIIAVRGNCDTEVDQMLLQFPILADYCTLFWQGKTVFATHGHRFNRDNRPPMGMGEILLHGHTHIPENGTCGDLRILNPGSVSIPKAGSAHGYMIYENGTFLWKTLDGEVYDTLTL